MVHINFFVVCHWHRLTFLRRAGKELTASIVAKQKKRTNDIAMWNERNNDRGRGKPTKASFVIEFSNAIIHF